jgi:hypothetical protein
LYGAPELEILLECSESELNHNENEAIEIFNSVLDGFNTLEHAEDMPKWKSKLKGDELGTSVYSNEQILKAAKLMCDYTLTLLKVSELTNISYATIKKIAQGVQHRWIGEKYPEIWNTLQSVREQRNSYRHSNHGATVKNLFSAKAQGITYPKVISPEGKIYEIENLSEFCRQNDLQRANMRKMFKGTRNSHKGWFLYIPSVKTVAQGVSHVTDPVVHRLFTG